MEIIVGNFDAYNLEIRIDKMRDVLNEMCCSIDEREVSIEKLTVSQQLDEIIVEYMKLKK